MSKTDNVKAGLILVAAAAVGYLAWRAYKGAGKAAQVVGRVITEDLNPASQNNLVNRAVNATVQAVTGDSGATLGTKVYDWLHPDAGPAPNQYDAETARLAAYEQAAIMGNVGGQNIVLPYEANIDPNTGEITFGP